MASYGGETPVNVTSIVNISTGGTGTKYTVPAGRYAKINAAIKFTYAGSGGRAIITIGDVTLENETTGADNGYTPVEFWLVAGQTITFTSGGGSSENHSNITIIEYNNPS